MPTDAITTICLNRQYQGWTDIPLNDAGLEQARIVADAIASESWDVLVSSPLQRAMQTASAIAAVSKLPDIVEILDLRERGYGDAEGLTLIEREAKWPGEDWPGLELYDTMAGRAMLGLAQVAEEHAGKRVLVVCHGGLINAVLARISDGEHGTGKTVILNTARSTLLFRNGAWEIETLTDASHLELAGAERP